MVTPSHLYLIHRFHLFTVPFFLLCRAIYLPISMFRYTYNVLTTTSLYDMVWVCLKKQIYEKNNTREKKIRACPRITVSATSIRWLFLIVFQYHFRVAVDFAFVAAAEDVAEDMGMAFEGDGGVAAYGTLGAAAENAAGASLEGL